VTKDDTPTVFEVIERRRGVTQQDPDERISHGLFGNRWRANRKRRELREAGIHNTVAIERKVQ
jgi:hypothetical protein